MVHKVVNRELPKGVAGKCAMAPSLDVPRYRGTSPIRNRPPPQDHPGPLGTGLL